MAWSRWCLPLILLMALALLGWANQHLRALGRQSTQIEMQVALPKAVQVATAGGDRYLAANLAGFRVLLANTAHMRADNYAVQAKLQADVAWLNPAHEDNYYIAAAMLPWNQQLPEAQYVLRRAMDARPFDWQPVFYYAFHLYHFNRQAAEAAKVLTRARGRIQDEGDRMALENLIALWSEKGYQLKQAIAVVRAMANGSQPGGFKRYLQARVQRLEGLQTLRLAAQRFNAYTGQRLRSLDQLVTHGFIMAIPSDPFGFGYRVDQHGEPILLNSPPTSN